MSKSTKTNTARSYAEEGLEDIQNVLPQAEELVQVSGGLEAEEEMQVVGGLEPITAFYQLKTPTKPGKTPVVIFEKGKTLKGTYERKLEREARTRDGRKFTSTTYLIRHDSDGKLYGYSGPGLRRGLEALDFGSKVHTTYLGSQEGRDGNFYENFLILGNKKKA